MRFKNIQEYIQWITELNIHQLLNVVYVETDVMCADATLYSFNYLSDMFDTDIEDYLPPMCYVSISECKKPCVVEIFGFDDNVVEKLCVENTKYEILGCSEGT
tara:strand:- start:1675 stop:1983 length:309 start_codon:yes stop_codon:yes gene_type:complete